MVATVAVSRVRDALPARTAAASGNYLLEWAALIRVNPRLRWASLGMVGLHAHVATSPFVMLWLHDDKGLGQAAAGKLYGTMFMVFGLAGSIASGVLADWALRRHRVDRARTILVLLGVLLPLILAYRLLPVQSGWFLPGMAASILFMTMLYAPLFSVIEEQVPAHLKATTAGINMLALNILMIGGLGLAIGMVSERLAEAGSRGSWTIPLLGADLVAGIALLFVWLSTETGCRSSISSEAGTS